MSIQQQTPRKQLKTRTGCLRCKQRRIKCDETYPRCNQCTRRAYDCPGYKRPLKWSTKYEAECQKYRGNSEMALGATTVERPEHTIAQFVMMSNESASGRSDGQVTGALGTAGQSAAFDGFEYPRAGSMHDSGSSRNQSGLDDSAEVVDLLSSNKPLGYIVESTTAEPLGWSDLFLPMTLSLQGEDAGIMRHYFSRVCRIQSCVDSDNSFFRVEIGNMMASCPLIYHCVLSMSAAHLAIRRHDLVVAALNHRTNAISCLKSEIMNMREREDLQSCSAIDYPIEALLGSILLGMTDGWHNSSFLGTTHLHGARVLFKLWISAIKNGTGRPLAVSCSSRVRSTIVGIMAYWEAMSSFLTSQSLDSMSYFEDFCDQNQATMIHPTPWTGIGTALFVYLARVGTLARQRSLIKNLCVLGKSEGVQDQLKTDVVESARDTEATLLSFQIPEKNRVEDAGDPSTPVTHLQQLAQIYRLSALLELYRNFPELLNAQPGATSDESATVRKILALTTSILTIIATIPQTSGVNCLVTLPLIIAGSSLQSTVEPSLRQIKSGETSWEILSDDIVSLSSQEDAQLYWRGFVRSRLQATRGYVGIATISMAIEIVEKVWTRCDVLALSLPIDFVQWIDVMKDEKLEAIFG